MLCESFWIHWKQYNATFISHMSMFANIALLGGGVRVIGFELENKGRSKEDQRHYKAFDGKLRHHSFI